MTQEPKKYCNPLDRTPNPVSKAVVESVRDLTKAEEEDILSTPMDDEDDGYSSEDIPGSELDDNEMGLTDELAAETSSICETNPSSIGCKVLGEQFIYHIQSLIKDIEEVKPAGYILAVGKLKGAIIKLQAGD
jgi:hypothetical protein